MNHAAYYHYLYAGKIRRYARRWGVVKSILGDMLSDMSSREFEETDIRTGKFISRMMSAPLDRPFVVTVINNRPVFVMVSKDPKASIKNAVDQPDLLHGEDWFLVDLALRKILRFYTSIDLSSCAQVRSRIAVMPVSRRKPFKRGRYLVARSLPEARAGLEQFDKPTTLGHRGITSITLINLITGDRQIFDGTRAVSEHLQYSLSSLRSLIHRATELNNSPICMVKLGTCPDLVFEITYATKDKR